MGTTTEKSPHSTKRAAVEETILQATQQLLAEGISFADLKIDRIAKAAGISRTAFYFYFDDKRALLVRLSQEVAGQLFAEAERWWSSEGIGEAELKHAFERVGTIYHEHAALLKAVVEVSTYDDQFALIWRSLIAHFVDATKERIEQAQRDGQAPPMPARETAFALAWMTERLFYQRAVQNVGGDEADFVDALTGIWLRAVYGWIDPT